MGINESRAYDWADRENETEERTVIWPQGFDWAQNCWHSHKPQQLNRAFSLSVCVCVWLSLTWQWALLGYSLDWTAQELVLGLSWWLSSSAVQRCMVLCLSLHYHKCLFMTLMCFLMRKSGEKTSPDSPKVASVYTGSNSFVDYKASSISHVHWFCS